MVVILLIPMMPNAGKKVQSHQPIRCDNGASGDTLIFNQPTDLRPTKKT